MSVHEERCPALWGEPCVCVYKGAFSLLTKHKHDYKYGLGTLCLCGKTKGLR